MLVGVACCTLTMCAVLAVFSPAPIELETAAVHDMRLGDAQLRRAQQLMQAGVQGAKRLSVSRKAKMQQLEGIGGIGSGEEDENGKVEPCPTTAQPTQPSRSAIAGWMSRPSLVSAQQVDLVSSSPPPHRIGRWRCT